MHYFSKLFLYQLFSNQKKILNKTYFKMNNYLIKRWIHNLKEDKPEPEKFVTNQHFLPQSYLAPALYTTKNIYLNKREYCCKKDNTSGVGRHKYHEDVENAVNEQILAELNACYTYLSVACYFGRTDVALPGCRGFFMLMHEEEHQHALILLNYQNMRGGYVNLCSLPAPECQEWKSIEYSLSAAVDMEKSVKEKLMELHDVAEKHHDLSVMDLVTNYFIEEQERSICELARMLIRAKKMGLSGIAEYLLDKEIHRAFVKKSEANFDPKPDPTAAEDKTKFYI